MDDEKKILIFTTELGHPSMKCINQDIVQGFAQLGLELVLADLNDASAMRGARHLLLNGQIAFSVGVNNAGKYMVDEEGKCIYEYIDTPYVSIMLDAPYNIATGDIGLNWRSHYVCVLDKTHIDALKYCYPNTKFAGSMLLPLGGSCGNDESKIFDKSRPLDVVFSAAINPETIAGPAWLEYESNPLIINILNDVVDYMLANPVSTLDALKIVLEDRGFYGEEYIRKFTPHLYSLFYYIKHKRRYRLMEMAAKEGLVVDVFGYGWEQVPFADKLRVHGEVGYEGVLDAFAKTKVVLQDQAEFNNGGHDRVFTAMLNGAVVVSEYSTYLEKKFEVNKDIFLFDWKNTSSQLEIIKKLIKDESMRLSSAISAYGKANANHRWVNRARSILEMLSMG